MKKKYTPYRHKSIPDLKAYEEGYILGMELALDSKPLDLKIIPYSRLFKPSAYVSYKLGVTQSYERGIKLRVDNKAYKQLKHDQRINELKELEEKQKRTQERER